MNKVGAGVREEARHSGLNMHILEYLLNFQGEL